MSGNTKTTGGNNNAGEGAEVTRMNTQDIIAWMTNPSALASAMGGEDDGPKPIPLLCCASLSLCFVLGLVGFSLFLAVFSIYVLANEGDAVKKDIFNGVQSAQDDCHGKRAWEYMLVYCISTWMTLCGVPLLTKLSMPKEDERGSDDSSNSSTGMGCWSCILAFMGFVATCAMVHFVTTMSDDCKTLWEKKAGNFWLCMQMICWTFVATLSLMGFLCCCMCCGMGMASGDATPATASAPSGAQRV